MTPLEEIAEAHRRALEHGLRGNWVRAWLWTVWADALQTMHDDSLKGDDR